MRAPSLRFGPYALDPATGAVVGPGGPAAVQPIVARALAVLAASPGEVVSRDALRADVWQGVHVSDDAVHQVIRKARRALGDVGRPHRWLRTVGHSGYVLVPDPPPAPAAGLPPQPGPPALLGRSSELGAALARLSGPACILTVTGGAGVGKSALAGRIGAEISARSPGAWRRVALENARSERDVRIAVAGALGLPPIEDGEDPLGDAIAGLGPAVVLFDDADLCRAALGGALVRWRADAPETAFLVTCRRPLDVPGEVLRLGPLGAAPARALLVQRALGAGAVDPADPVERAALDRLVAELDGLPLALELAAMRARVFGFAVVAERLADRFRLLAAPGTAGERHGALRGAIEASIEAATPDERRALAQAAVFSGPFTVEAAEAIIDPGGTWPLDVLHGLVEHGLMRRDVDGRLALGRSVRALADERLDAIGERTDAERRHGAWYARFGDPDWVDGLDSEGGASARREVVEAREELLAACRRAIDRSDPSIAAMALRGAWAAVQLTGPPSTVVALATEVLALPGLRGAARWDAAWTLGDAARLAGEMEIAQRAAEAAVDAALAMGDDRRRARSRALLGSILAVRGRSIDALAAHEEALALASAAGDPRTVAVVMGNLGNLRARQGRRAEARDCYLRALEGHRAVGNRRVEAAVLGYLASLDLAEGRVEQAIDGYELAIERHRAIGDARFALRARVNRSAALVSVGRTDEAVAELNEALGSARASGARRLEVLVRCNLAAVLQDRADRATARAHLEAARALVDRVRDRRLTSIVAGLMGEVARSQGRPDDADPELSAALGIAREIGDPTLTGRWLAGLADVARMRGDLQQATSLAREADRASPADAAAERVELLRIRALIARDAGDLAGARALATAALAGCATVAAREELSRRLPADLGPRGG